MAGICPAHEKEKFMTEPIGASTGYSCFVLPLAKAHERVTGETDIGG